MQKELNPELFSEKRVSRSSENLSAPEMMTSGQERHVLELRQHVAALGEEFRKMATQTQEFMKNTHLKAERLQQQMGRLEQSHNGLAQESAQKLTQVSHRLAERKALDQKINEMVDRHGQVIKSFEVRMNQLQRLLAEKESQLSHAHASINEMKMELSRLRRL